MIDLADVPTGELLVEVERRRADLIADQLASRMKPQDAGDSPDQWLTVIEAAAHLCIGRDRLRKLARSGEIPYQQSGPGCKLYFKRADLDRWRETGGRAMQAAPAV